MIDQRTGDWGPESSLREVGDQEIKETKRVLQRSLEYEGAGEDPREKETRRRGRGLERSSRAKLLFYFKRKKKLSQYLVQCLTYRI